jgi:hypothetical protein
MSSISSNAVGSALAAIAIANRTVDHASSHVTKAPAAGTPEAAKAPPVQPASEDPEATRKIIAAEHELIGLLLNVVA